MSDFIVPVKAKPKNVTTIILGALSAYRNKQLGPVSLANVGESTLISKQLSVVNTVFPLSETFLVTGYYAQSVLNNKPDGLRIIENQMYENSGNAEEIKLAINATLNDKILIMNGNVLPSKESVIQMKNHGSCILVKDEESDEVGSNVFSGKMEILAYGLKYRWYNIVMLQSNEVNILKKFVNKKDKARYYLHEILNYIVNHGGIINVVKTNNKIEVIDK